MTMARDTIRPIGGAEVPGAYRRARLVVVEPDTGCHLHQHCLTCTEPVCYFELVDELPPRSKTINERVATVTRLRTEGLTVEQIAIQLNVAERTVFNDLNRAKQPKTKGKTMQKGTCPECRKRVNTDNNGKISMHPAAGAGSRRERIAAGQCQGVGRNPSRARSK